MTTQEQAKAAIEIVTAVADAIKELGSVPSGHLYARLMGHMSLTEYEQIIGFIVRSGLVRQDKSHLLTWIG